MSAVDLEIKKKLGSIKPLLVLNQWLNKAKHSKFKEPWAMILSTSVRGQVNSRVVLLKQIYKSELVFYTNYLSSKGKEIANNSLVAVNFYWPQLNKQIRIQGKVKKTSRNKSILYWKKRNRESQISQWISCQSQAVQSRKELENLKEQAEKQFQSRKIPCPKHWGGYAIQIKKIEFWINQKHRLHDRFLFEKIGKSWKKKRLFP